MTNFENIKSMSIDELAEFIYIDYIQDCNYCPCDEYDHKDCYSDNCDCVELIKQWLNLKVKK